MQRARKPLALRQPRNRCRLSASGLHARAARTQRLRYARRRLNILVYTTDCLHPKGHIVVGSLPFASWFFCFHDQGDLLSPCPLLPDHLTFCYEAMHVFILKLFKEQRYRTLAP
jgi:hypothetical protein